MIVPRVRPGATCRIGSTEDNKQIAVIKKIDILYQAIGCIDQRSRELRTVGRVKTWIRPGYSRFKALAVFPPSGTLSQHPGDSGCHTHSVELVRERVHLGMEVACAVTLAVLVLLALPSRPSAR